jgi:cytoskeleton protein RodZ
MLQDSASLGLYLRQERERRNVSLQDISAITKIQLRFLEALERDEHTYLPPAPFVSGFLRAYAQCLSLNPETILAAYHATQHIPEEPVKRRLPLPPPRRRLGRLWTAIAGVIVVALALILGRVWYEPEPGPPVQSIDVPVVQEPSGAAEHVVTVQPPVDRPDAGPPQVKKPAVLPEVPIKPPALPPATGPGEGEHRSTKPLASPVQPPPSQEAATTPETAPPETPEQLVLQAKALQETWVRVRIDGDKRNNDVLLASGKTIRWQASERFLLTVGNAQGTRLTLNGQEIALPSGRNNVVRDLLLTRQSLN